MLPEAELTIEKGCGAGFEDTDRSGIRKAAEARLERGKQMMADRLEDIFKKERAELESK